MDREQKQKSNKTIFDWPNSIKIKSTTYTFPECANTKPKTSAERERGQDNLGNQRNEQRKVNENKVTNSGKKNISRQDGWKALMKERRDESREEEEEK
jgi:hypothetical protein